MSVNRVTEYMDYLEDHRRNVQEAYDSYMIPLASRIRDPELVWDIRTACSKIPLHDLSKYSTQEFEGYRMRYYPQEGDPPVEVVNAMYEEAREHHRRENPHHYQHWVDEDGPQDMSGEAIIEMICDWIAMSVFDGNDVSEWWADEKKKVKKDNLMTDWTMDRVDMILKLIGVMR